MQWGIPTGQPNSSRPCECNAWFRAACKNDRTPSKSLHRMLSPKGYPSMDNMAAIFGAIGSRLKVSPKVHTVRAA